MIGLLDSGIGGLTVANALQSVLAEYDMIYYGDTACAPYGGRSPEKIMQYAERSLQFLVEQGAIVIVVACSTISSLAGDHFRRTCPLPLVDAVTAAASTAATASSASAKIGVIGTSGTVKSLAHAKAVRQHLPQAKVYSVAAPLLVPMIEAGWLKRPEFSMALKKYLHPLKQKQIQTLIMGCNHYAVIKNMVQRKIGKRVQLVDSAFCLAHSLRDYLAAHEDVHRRLARNGICRYFFSDLTADLAQAAKRFFHCSRPLEKAVLP